MGKIKVAFFSDMLIENFDGATRTMFQIINRIPKDEFEYLFVCGMPPTNDIGFEVMKMPTLKIPSNDTYQMAFIAFSKNKIRKKLNEFQPDIIQFASPSPMSSFASKYALEKNIPIVTIYHTHFYSYTQYYLSFAPFIVPSALSIVARISRFIYNKADIVYVPTLEIKKQLIEKCQLKSDNIRIWGRGINHERFKTSYKNKAALVAVTQNNKPNVLFASRVVKEKNLELLVNLQKINNQNGNTFNLIIAGDGVAKNDMERKMQDAFFLGAKKQKELSELYASCDVFVFPSITETFGNVITEAMASGLPCVLANEGGHISYTQHQETALLCKPNDAQVFYDAIQELLQNTDLRNKIIQNGLDFTNTLQWESLVNIHFNDLRALAIKKKN